VPAKTIRGGLVMETLGEKDVSGMS